jgi:hypothetical protein
MLIKIRELPEKVAFTIGLSLIFVSPIVLLFISVGKWMTIVIQSIVWAVAFLFILSAADRRHSRIGNNK